MFLKQKELYPLKDDYVKKLAEEITRLENKANSLQERFMQNAEKLPDEGLSKRHLLENLIKNFAKRSWWGRAEKIGTENKEG